MMLKGKQFLHETATGYFDTTPHFRLLIRLIRNSFLSGFGPGCLSLICRTRVVLLVRLKR